MTAMTTRRGSFRRRQRRSEGIGRFPPQNRPTSPGLFDGTIQCHRRGGLARPAAISGAHRQPAVHAGRVPALPRPGWLPTLILIRGVELPPSSAPQRQSWRTEMSVVGVSWRSWREDVFDVFLLANHTPPHTHTQTNTPNPLGRPMCRGVCHCNQATWWLRAMAAIASRGRAENHRLRRHRCGKQGGPRQALPI